MRSDDGNGTVSFIIQSLGERRLSRVRFERRADLAVQEIGMRLENGAVVVMCSATALIEAESAFEPDGPGMAGLTLRDGPLALRIQSGGLPGPHPDAPHAGPWGSSKRDRCLPSFPRTAGLSDAEEAEWQVLNSTETTRVVTPIEVELPRAASARQEPFGLGEDDGDWPTRIQVLNEEISFEDGEGSGPRDGHSPWAPSPVASRSAQRSVTAEPRLRPAVRRFALAALFLISLMLWFHAYRTRRPIVEVPFPAATRAPRPSQTDGPAPLPPPEAGANEGPPAVDERVLAVPAASPPGAGSPLLLHPGAVSKARVAADALANGTYGDALKVYDELAAKPGSNPAYAQVARSLRARSAQPSP